MEVHSWTDRWWPRPPGPMMLVLAALAYAVPATAQAASPTSPAITDSAHAVATACSIVQSLRPAGERFRCRVKSYRETSSEYIVRLREDPKAGAPRPPFYRSEVRLPKAGGTVTVTREADL